MVIDSGGRAEVLAADGRGCPALLRRRIGRGSLILCTYPVEHMAALTPQVNPGDTVTLYDALARYARVCRLVTVDDPRVTGDTLTRDDGTRFAVLASHADEPLTVKPALGTGSRLIALDGTEITAGVNLDPFGINLLKWPEMAASGAQGLTGSQVAHGGQWAW